MQLQANEKTEDFITETRWGYTIDPAMKEIWSVELEILKEFDRVCDNMHLKYFLDSGTLLGAVRDGRFIPWDDDIDVIMLRDDYDKLVEDRGKSFSQEYFFQCAYTDIEYPRGHAQLRKKGTCAMIPYESAYVKFNQGIFIDIFVLDGVSPDKEKLKQQFVEKNKLLKYLNLIGIPASTKKINTYIKQILRIPAKMLHPKFNILYAKYEKICKRYNNSEFVDKIMFREDPNKVLFLQKDWFSKAISCNFEGMKVPIPIGYENILKTYFGENYMIPSKIPTMHGGLIFDINKSYKEVLKEK